MDSEFGLFQPRYPLKQQQRPGSSTEHKWSSYIPGLNLRQTFRVPLVGCLNLRCALGWWPDDKCYNEARQDCRAGR